MIWHDSLSELEGGYHLFLFFSSQTGAFVALLLGQRLKIGDWS